MEGKDRHYVLTSKGKALRDSTGIDFTLYYTRLKRALEDMKAGLPIPRESLDQLVNEGFLEYEENR